MRMISHQDLDELTVRAMQSPRRRQHQNIHQHYADPSQRLFNAVCPDSYIRPHRHRLDAKDETLLALRGSFALLQFDDVGNVSSCCRFSANAGKARGLGVDVMSDEWHTVLAIEPGSVLLEIKAGPFDSRAAKELAPWAPEEDSPRALPYHRSLLRVASLVTEELC